MNMQHTSPDVAPPGDRRAPEIAAQLIANGYRPVPCAGKRALPTGWTTRDFCEWDFEPGQNVGIKTGQGVALVDIDVTDPTVSEAIQAEFLRRHPEAGTLKRTGQAPKTGFLVASDLEKKIDLKLPAVGERDKIEVLANGQQFVAYGIHPDTRAPYHWHGLDPLDTFLGVKSMLPFVSAADLIAFKDWVAETYGPKETGPKLSDRAAKAGGFKIDPGNGSGGFFRAVNDAALQSLDLWVSALFPAAKKYPNGAWRVTSRDLGRDYQEDLSIHPDGIQDFGPEAARTAIDLVQEFGGAPDATAAASWLCEKMGRTRESLGWVEGGKPPKRAKGKGAAVEITEDAVALLFTQKHRHTMRYDHDAGKWYRWQGDRWAADSTGAAFDSCRELARAASAGESDKVRVTAGKASFAAGVERMARADRAHAVTQSTWDQNPWLLGCPGVTVDLRTGQARKADQADGITKQAAIAPAVTADCPMWLHFLDDATGGDAELIRFLRAWCGYSLTGDIREHALLFIYGGGGNGKSVFLNTVAGILGDYATTAAMDTFTASRNDKHPTDLAMLRGARMVTASETEEGRAWAESRIKQLTGGDKISARFMRQDFFEFAPQFKLTIVGNHQPTLRNVDDAAKRRFNIVPFTRKPTKPDRELEQKLRAEWPGILRWMIDGTADWRANGLTKPASVAMATAAYFDEQDMFGQWLADDCTVELGNRSRWETSADLFAKWQEYAKAAGEEPGSAKLFGQNMTRRGFGRSNKKVSGRTLKCWDGLSIIRPAVPGTD